MNFTRTVVYFALKHSLLYNKYSYLHTDTDVIRRFYVFFWEQLAEGNHKTLYSPFILSKIVKFGFNTC